MWGMVETHGHASLPFPDIPRGNDRPDWPTGDTDVEIMVAMKNPPVETASLLGDG